ncbi:MAG: proton-conducting transporter membrane subunit [Gimesia sp.]
MNLFLHAIISMSPMLLVVMPVAGACFAWGVSRMGPEFTRWTAFSNTLISCLILVAVMFSPSLRNSADDKDERPTRSISVSLELPHETESDIETARPHRIHWAIDTTTLWFLLLPTCLWPVLILFASRFTAASGLHYFLLLMLQAFLAGVFVSHDLLSFATFLLLTTFCTLCLIRLGSGARSKQVFESTMYLQFLGDAFIIGGLLLAAVAYSWMQGLLLEAPQTLTLQFYDLLQGTAKDTIRYSLAAVYWSTVSAWIFLLLLTGFIVKGALFPVHYGFTQWLPFSSPHQLSTHNPIGWYLVLLALITKTSIYGMIRFMIPLNFEVGSSISSVLSFWGICGFLLSALSASLRKDLFLITVWFLIGQSSLTLAVLFTAQQTVIPNFILLNVVQGLACCLLLLIVPLINSESNNRANKLHLWIVGLSVFTLMGVPGLGGFTAQFTFLWSLANQNMILAASYILGTLFFNLAMIRALWQLLKTDRTKAISSDDESNSVPNENMGLTWLAISPSVLLILVIGISPATLLEKTLFPLNKITVTTANNLTEEIPTEKN